MNRLWIALIKFIVKQVSFEWHFHLHKCFSKPMYSGYKLGDRCMGRKIILNAPTTLRWGFCYIHSGAVCWRIWQCCYVCDVPVWLREQSLDRTISCLDRQPAHGPLLLSWLLVRSWTLPDIPVGNLGKAALKCNAFGYLSTALSHPAFLGNGVSTAHFHYVPMHFNV